jgi:hypothetical protein
MLNRLSNKLRSWAKGWLVFILFLLDVAFVGFIMPIAAALMKGDAGGPGRLTCNSFNACESVWMIEAYGEYTRHSIVTLNSM